jgi:hypothetical protein
MKKAINMHIIRASEVGAYLYCARAWWYQQQGVENSNQAGLQAGTQLHQLHGRQVAAASGLRLLAGLFLLAAVVLFGLILFRFL